MAPFEGMKFIIQWIAGLIRKIIDFPAEKPKFTPEQEKLQDRYDTES